MPVICLEPVKQGRPKAESTKMPINIRLSPEVVNYFKDSGKGWQTRMNKVLEDYVAHH
ncbi:MAG: BrnA antitoxin family protein [Methylococcales bacterium]